MVLEGMHAKEFEGHNTFKIYDMGTEMGTASAGRIYNIGAHGITEIHGIQLHEAHHSWHGTHITPFGGGIEASPIIRQQKEREQERLLRAQEEARNPRPPPPPPPPRPRRLPPRRSLPPPLPRRSR